MPEVDESLIIYGRDGPLQSCQVVHDFEGVHIVHQGAVSRYAHKEPIATHVDKGDEAVLTLIPTGEDGACFAGALVIRDQVPW